MKYTIITLNDDRKEYFEKIRETIDGQELFLSAVNGSEVDIHEELSNRGLRLEPIWPNAKLGEIGVWLSNYDRWVFAAGIGQPLIVFEDDAILDPAFNPQLARVIKELPDNWDYCALWVPENQRQDYLYNFVYNQRDGKRHFMGYTTPENSIYKVPGCSTIARAYQGYGTVAMMYSPQGGAKLAELARKTGLTGPVDCWIHEHSHLNNVYGYAPKPDQANLVHYDWKAKSHVQLTDRIT